MDDPTVQAYAILLDGRHVGNVVLDQIDAYLSSARFSMYLGEPETRGIGVGRTAAYLAVSEGFNLLKLNKVWLIAHSGNLPALRTYQALGFTLEGIHRQEFKLDNGFRDVFYMGLLRDEFEQVKSQAVVGDA